MNEKSMFEKGDIFCWVVIFGKVILLWFVVIVENFRLKLFDIIVIGYLVIREIYINNKWVVL